MNTSTQLIEILSARFGRRLDVLSTVTDGDISQAFAARLGSDRIFVKWGTVEALARFQAEAAGLASLAAVGSHVVPEAIAVDAAGDVAWLVLDWLDLSPIRDEAQGRLAGQALAQLHRDCGSHFGWAQDNFLGATPQANDESAAWPLFFAQKRLRPQLALAQSKGLDPALIADGEKLADKLPAFFVDHQPAPSLLHGDLWHGNAALCGGKPALFDPAVYRGDREADVAMTELFGGFPVSFYAGYRDAWPLPPDFEQRKNLYNLYHIFNHLNLFGRSYLGQAKRMVAQLLEKASR